ncbi:MAG TPA: GGDEF domain-containing protein [Terriglobia bacterium]|nr:GGDEF domain-containing protein [Terriglobia bacterium]
MSSAGAPGRDANWESLERQDWHLWVLAVLLMFVLGVSLLSFMFPSVFWLGRQSGINAPERAFFGFCILLALTLVYMLQRQAAVRRLKRSLYEARVAAIEAEQQMHVLSLTSLPELNQFRDSLAMEFRRASHANENLSVILLHLETAPEDKLGRAAQLLRQMLRPHETLYRVSRQRLALILPAMRTADVEAFANQIAERLRRLLPGEPVSATVLAYPEQATSLAELEGRLRLLVAAGDGAPGTVDSSVPTH